MKSAACLLSVFLVAGCAHRNSVTTPAAPALQDSIDWVAAVSVPGHGSTELQRGKLQRFDVTLRYTLASRKSALLSLSMVQFRNPDTCVVSGGEYIEADEIPIRRGTHVVTLPLTWPGDTGLRTKGRIFGHGSISFAAAMWRGHLTDRFYTNSFGRNFCLRFGVPS